MSKPTIQGLPSSIYMSACQLLVNSVDVGLLSNVKLKLVESAKEAKTDQMGDMAVNHFYAGTLATGECEFDEFTVQKMKTAFPQASLVGSGSTWRLGFGKQVGFDYRSLALPFVFIPTSDDTTTLTHNYKFWLGVFMGEAELDWTVGKKLMFKAKMQFYPDPTQSAQMQLGYMGDASAGSFTASTHSSDTPGGGNVGNETITSVTTNDTYTKTETWTLTCLLGGGAGTGLFSVVGSVSGARGVATVGTAFHSNSITTGNSEVNFTITHVSTNCAVGDTHVFTTTAATYT